MLVVGEGCDDGVLVNSEGSDYARYAAFSSGVRQLLAAEEQCLEQEFVELIGQIPGADIENAGPWLQHARALAEADVGAVGSAAHPDYCRRLREFCDAFRKIDRLYAETPAEIFNYKPGYRPEELLPAADWISNGSFADEAYALAPSGAFQPVHYAANRIMESWQMLGDGAEIEYCFAELHDSYGLQPGQMSLLMEELRGHEGVAELEPREGLGTFRVRFAPYEPEQTAQGALMPNDLIAMQARHTLWTLDQPDGVRADFSGQTLTGLDFSDTDFSGAIFVGASLYQCELSEGCFSGSDFTGAKLRGVTAFEGDFTNVNFTDATLEYCDFTDAEHCGAFFADAEIVECDGLDGIAQGQTQSM